MARQLGERVEVAGVVLQRVRDHGYETIDTSETPCCFYCRRDINADDTVDHYPGCVWLEVVAATGPPAGREGA